MPYCLDYLSYKYRFSPQAEYLFGWLFWVKRPFETVLQSISGRLPEREIEVRNDRREEKFSNNPHPHLLQAQ